MSYDKRYRHLALEYWADGHTKKETAAVFGVGTSTLDRWKSQLKETGTLESKKREGSFRKIDPKKLRKYVSEHPDAYQHEIAATFGVRLFAIQKALKRLKITRKKTTEFAEANEFIQNISALPPEILVFVDECGIDQYLYREFAYAPRGEKVMAKISGKKFKRTNIVAGICCGEWVVPLAYECSTDSVLFEFWFEHCLLKEVGPGSVIVLDNASFHRKSVLPELAERYECRALFLPPYSPDLNPIEKKWAWMKQKLRDIFPVLYSFELALQLCF